MKLILWLCIVVILCTILARRARRRTEYYTNEEYSKIITVDDNGDMQWEDLSKVGLPIGSIIIWSSPDIPDGWIRCQKDLYNLSEIKYSKLLDVLGGEANFPDFASNRIPVGLNESDDDFNAMGKKGGVNEVQINSSKMPSHHHEIIYSPSNTGNYEYKYSQSKKHFLLPPVEGTQAGTFKTGDENYRVSKNISRFTLADIPDNTSETGSDAYMLDIHQRTKYMFYIIKYA